MLSQHRTDEDGRVAGLLADQDVQSGTYTLRFALSDYFGDRDEPAFFPHADVAFTVHDTDTCVHVPLLASRYSYTTYRGS